jgi:4-amino-4-deoxy-L-arabinose transferase-like glycosyltransferase
MMKRPINWRKAGNWLAIALLVLMLGRFVAQTYARMLTNANSGQGDQPAFLQLGLDLRERGVLTDGTRNPLYAAFLALIARREWAYFTQAKLLSMLFGVLAIIALYLLAGRFFNRFTALVAAYLLSINVEFIVHSATVLTESLLVLIFILAWFAMLKALAEVDRPRYWVTAGLLAGLAYLAKGSGQLLALAFVAVALFCYRLRLFRGSSLWLFLGGYALAASPLWVYNTIHFGSPTFNYAITHQMWLDNWNEWHPDAVENLPTLASFLQSHTPAEIVERQWRGMQAMRNILVKTLWPTRTLMIDRFLLSPVSGYTLALLALAPLLFWRASRDYVRQNQGAVYLAGLATLIFFVLFAWYDAIVALGSRFLLPVIPLIFVMVAHIASRLGQAAIAQGIWARRLIYLAAALIILLQLYWAIRTTLAPAQALLTQNVFAQDRQFNADAAQPLAWLAEQSPQPGRVAWGPSGNSLPAWAYSDRLDFKRYPPEAETIPELTANLVGRGVGFIIIDQDMTARYRNLLKQYFPTDGARLKISRIPADWALTYAYRAMPCDWCIFRLLPSQPAQHRVDYQLGQAIGLTGYDLSKRELQAGETLYLTLHWTALAPVERDYTVFTQLLGPDFQLHGQMDHQPINNLWPTNRWQPGDHLADRYDIPIEANAPTGEYQLLVGMYHGPTGERLPATHQGSPLPDNAIHLTTITLLPCRTNC